MQIYSKTDTGRVRSTNQDAFFAGRISKTEVIAIICDGMGGAKAGNIASEMAVKVILDYVTNSYRVGMDENQIEKMLKNAIESANIDVYDMAQKSPDFYGMGTTAVVAFCKDDRVIIAHAGDSRAYLISDGITQITRDHSVVQSLLEQGEITEEDAKLHPEKNIITRAIGAEADILSDSDIIDIKKGETILLCTDGLSNYVDKNIIFDTVKNTSCEKLPDELIRLANKNGGGDNITVITLTK